MALKNLESYIEKRKKRTDEEGTIKSGFVTKTKDSSTDFESNAKSYYVRKYAPEKAAAYLEGVKNYKPAEVHNSEYYSPYYDRNARGQWQKDYDEAFDNEYKKHFQNLAASDRRYGQMNEQVSQGIKNAEKGYQQVIDSRNAFYSQFADEQEYNDYKRNQELLSFDVPAAKQRLEQLKADREKRVTLPTGYSYTYTVNDNDEEISRLENEVASAEELQQFAKDMNDPIKRAEYERLQREQENFNSWYEQQNPLVKFGTQAGNVGLNLLYGLGDAGYGVLEMAKNGVGAGVSLLDPYNITGLNPNYEGSAGDVIDDNVQGFIDYAHNIKATQDRFNSYYNQGLKTDLLKATGNNELSDFLGDTISNTANAVAEVIPSMALAYATGGTSLGATAIKGTSGLTKAQAAAKLTQGTLKGLMKNPSFFYTFIREGGSAYNEAKASGADELEAAIAMFGTGLPNAMIEIGGGIEALPKDKSVKGIRQWLKNMVKTGSEEGLEEIKQGVVSQLMAKATYAPEMQLFTVGADGIIDPQRMLQEFYGGFVGGAFGGAVGTGINKAVEAYNLHDYNKAKKATQIQLAMTYTGVIENLAQQYPDSTLSQLHSEISEMQEKGEAVSEKQYIKLYNAFIEAAKTADTDHKAQLLQSFGSTEQTAKANAVTISKALDGKRLSVKEAQALYNDNGSMRFMEEVLGKKINSVEELVNMSKEGDLQTGNNATTGDNMLDAVLNSHVNMEKGADTLKNAEYQYNNQLSGRISNLVNIGGKQTRIAAIRNSGTDTAMTVELEDGTVTDESGIEYSDPVSQAVFQTAAEYDTPLANVFIKGYDGRSSVGTYNRTFDDVVSAARVGLSSAQVLNANPLIAQVMSTDTLNQAVSLAQNSVAEEHTAYNIARNERYGGQKRFKGRTVINSSVNKNLAKNERAFADFIARVTGYEVEITNDSQMMAQGEFDSTKGKIIINLARGDFFATAIHELTHYTALNSPAEYEAFKNEIISWLTSKGMLNQYLDKYTSLYADNVATIDDLTEEVVANAAEALIKSEKFLSDLMLDEDFVSHISDNKAKSFIKRVMEKLGSLVKALKSYLKSADVNHSIARDIAQDVNELEKMSELWTKAFKSAAINHSEVQSIAQKNTDTESSGDVKYSIVESVTDEEGNIYKNVVKIDADIFKGIKPRYWSGKFIDFVENTLMNKKIPVFDSNGNVEIIEFAKAKDSVKKDGAKHPHKVIDKLKRKTDNNSKLVIVNLEEVISVSTYESENDENTHQWLDENGWEFRTAYIQMENGDLYSVTLNIAKASHERNILYDVNRIHKIKKSDRHTLLSQTTENSSRFGKPHSDSSDIVSQTPGIVKDDSKNSLPETDSKGNELTEQQREYFKDSKIVDSNGNLKVMYHGSPNSFTVFDKKKAKSGGYYGNGFYFTDSEAHAHHYGNAYIVYLNITNPLQDGTYDITKAQLRKFVAALAEDEDYGIENYGYDATVDSVTDSVYGKSDFAMLLDLNSGCVGNMAEAVKLFNEVNGTDYDGIVVVTETVAFYPEQIKNTDNKTPTTDEDIRFSLPESDTASYDILARENEDLKAQVEALENEMKLTKGHKVKPEAVKKLARKLLREYSSTMDAEELSAELEKIFNYVADTENASADIASKAMYSLAKRIINESRSLDTTLSDQYRNVTEYLRKTKIRVSPGMESELAYLYGSYNDFRKSNFGRLSLSRDDGSAVDSVWQELNSLAPELFPEEAFPDSDMLPRIAEALDMIAPEYVNPYGQDTDSFVSGLASEIFDSYFDTPEIRTFADKKAAELRKAVNKSRQHLAQLRAKDKARYQERYEKLKADSKEKLNAVKADNKRKTAEKLLKQKAKYQNMAKEKAEKQRETAEKSKLRHRIEKNSKTMMKWLNENSDKHHVPEVLRETTATFLSALDFVSFQQRANERKGKVSQSTTSWNEALRRLKDIISDYIPNDNGETKAPDFELDIDPDFMDRLSEFIRLQTMPVKPIPEMNSEQLREIDYIVTVLKSAITTANSFYLNRMAENVAEIGDATISQLQAKKSKQLNNNAVDKLLNMHMLDSGSFFRELGPAAESIYAEIREGFNKRVRCIEQAQKYMQELLKDVDVSDWTGDKATVHTFKINGEELKMTTAQMMSLYELWKRKQAQEHITKGGIVPTEIKLGKKLLNKVFGAVEPVRLSETDLVRIFSELTPQQREIADKMQKFLSKNCSDWGNEVSMAMYGYRKFTEPDYFPIKSSDNEVKSSDGNTSQSGLYKIKNQGMTKATVKGANNAIQVDDIFNTFTTHVVEMADYNAYAMPLSDAMKWYNYKVRDTAGRMNTVKAEMERTYGKQAKAYFIQLIKDINGDAGNATASEISTALLGKMKAASVAGNVRVALQQPTSIARAMVLMDPQYIGLGVTNMLKNPNKAIKEAQEHSSIAQWKSWGYFDTGLGKSLKEVITGQTPLRDKIVEKTMILAAYGDKVTWGALWEACKLEVAKNISPDSNGYMEAVTKRFDEIIDKTQVVDTVLHRSQIMRSKDTAVKMATSFMSEPTKTYNLMRNAITDMYHNRTKESVTNFARTTGAVMFTAVLTAAAAALSDAFRDDDKSKDWGEKYIDNFFENIVDNANPLNMVPYIKDIVSVLNGYDVQRNDITGFAGFFQCVKQLFDKIATGKEINFFNTVYDMSRYVSQFTGIPIFNLLREADSVIDIFADPLFRKDKTKAADVYVKLYDALISGNDAETDKMYQKLIEDGKDLQAIESGLRTQLLNPESEIYEDRIVEAAKARLDGNTAEYMRLMKEVIADTGLSQDFWVKTVNTQINRIRNDGKELSEDKEFLIKNGLSAETVEGMTEQQIKETVKQYQTSSYKDLTAGDSMSLYDMNDLATAVTKGDTESFKEVYQDILEAKVDELLQKDNLLTMKKAEEKAKSSLKSSITSKLKPVMKELYKTDRDKFHEMRIYLVQNYGYDNKTVNGWTI